MKQRWTGGINRKLDLPPALAIRTVARAPVCAEKLVLHEIR